MVLLSYFRNEYRYFLERCGDNALEVLFELARKKDIRVVTMSYRYFPNIECDCVLENTGDIARSPNDILTIWRKLSNEGKLPSIC